MSELQGKNIIQQGLVIHLDSGNPQSFDGNSTIWRDLSGNGNNGTLTNGVSYSSGNRGSMVFDGTDDYVSVSSGINSIIKGSTFPFSISFWCYCNENGTRDVFFGDYIGLATNCFNIERNSGTIANNSLRFYWGGNPDYYANLLMIPQNTWVNVCISYNGSNISFYKNGVLVNVNTIVLPLYTKSSGNYQIGKDSRDGTTALNGQIPIVQVYNRALSQEEITQNYNATKDRFNTIVYNGLVLNLDASNSLSYDGTTTWRDLSGNNNHGTLVNGVGYSSSNSGSLVFDGTNDKVTFGNGTISNTNGITVNLWFNTSSGSKYQDIFDLNDSQGIWIVTSSGQIKAGFNTTTNPIVYNYLPNTWYNVTLSGIGTTNSLYINGGLVGTKTETVRNNMNLTNARIGNVDGDRASEYFIGMIPTVQIYNRVLSQDEITQNYNATKSKFGL